MDPGVLEDISRRLTEVRLARPGKQVQLSESEIKQLCVASRDIFHHQPNLLELEAPIMICDPNIVMGMIDVLEKTYSRGVTIKFKNEEDSRAFHCAAEEWKNDPAAEGTSLPNGVVSTSKSKFDDKIEPASAKVYFHYYGQLLHQQNMLQDYVRTGYNTILLMNLCNFDVG